MTTLQIIGLIVVALLGLYVFYCIYDLDKYNNKKDRRNKHRILTMALLIFAMTIGKGAWAQDFSIEATYNSSTHKTLFTIERSGSSLPQQTIKYRTVNLSAYAGIHYTAVSDTYTFPENITTLQVEVSEYDQYTTSYAYHYQTDTTRSYRFEVLDVNGFELAHNDRSMTTGAQFSTTYLNNGVTDLVYFNDNGQIQSGSGNKYLDVSYSSSNWTQVTDAGYSQGVHTVSTNSLYNSNSNLRTILNALSYKMYATVYFTQKEEHDGYQYIQIYTGNAGTYDKVDDPNGGIGTLTNSLYRACFILSYSPSGSVMSDPHYQFFPHRYNYVDKAAEIAANITHYEFDYNNSHLYEQKFINSSYNSSTSGSLVLLPTAENINIRFDAGGGGNDHDEWDFKNLKVRLALVDETYPTPINIAGITVSAGPYVKGNTFYISVPFSEIVNTANYSGYKKLVTSWGDATYCSGDGTNVITFKGTINANAGTTLAITSLQCNFKDLTGTFFQGLGNSGYTDSFDKTFNGVTCTESYTLAATNTEFTGLQSEYVVSNTAIEPHPTVYFYKGKKETANKVQLTENTNYTLSWANNNAAGTGSVTATGINSYTGSASTTFPIRWSTYTVSFYGNGSIGIPVTGTMSDQAFQYGVAQSLSANAFSREGFTFAGWNTQPDGSGASYSDGEAVTGLTSEDGAVIDLYAQWTATLNTCPAPTNLTVVDSLLTATTAGLNWHGSIDVDNYTVRYRVPEHIEGGINETFEATSIPMDWAMYTGHLDTVMIRPSALTPATYGWAFGTLNGVFDNHARVNIYSNNQRWLVTPPFTLGSGTFTFDMALTKYSGTLLPVVDSLQQDDKFIVLISTDNMTTWTILREWNNSGSSYVYNNITCSAEGEQVSIDLSAYVGQRVRIAFYGESTNPTDMANTGGDNNLHIDNVIVGNPTVVPDSDWQTTGATATNLTLTGLTPETTYEAQVKSTCSDPEEWSNVVTFTTMVPVLVPEVTVSNSDQTVCLGDSIEDMIITATNGTITSVTGLPAGVEWSGTTISGTPTVSGTFNVTVTVSSDQTPDCGEETATATITVNPLPEVTVTNNVQTICMDNQIQEMEIIYSNGTIESVTGLPENVNWSDTPSGATIFGAPAEYGTFNATVTVTSDQGCGTATADVTITVKPNPEVTVSNNFQTVCENSAITAMEITATHATIENVTGLPTGVSWSKDSSGATGTISGTPTASGTYNVTVTVNSDQTPSCGIAYAYVRITVNPLPEVTVTNDNQTVCAGDAIVAMEITATNGTIANVEGLPAGLTWSGTMISGIPEASGTATVTVTSNQTPNCGTATATVTITVNPLPEVTVSNSSQIVCLGNSIETMEITATNATITSVEGLPDGVTWSGTTISGIPEASGTATVTVTSNQTPECSTATAAITITVNPLPEVTVSNSSQIVCLGNSIETMEITATNATIANVEGLPAGVTWSGTMISGTPTESGTFNVTVMVDSYYGCGIGMAELTIIVNPLPEAYTLDITGYGDSDGGWNLIASPLAESIAATEVGNLVAETASDFDLYRFNQAANMEWENWKQEESEHYHFNLESGQGYLYASKEDVTLTFLGTPNSDDAVNVSLSYTEGKPLAGFNLVGNPFAENATLNKSYYSMNAAGTGLVATAADGSTPIAPCTGVIVQATEANQSVTFTKVTRGETSTGNGSLNIALGQAQGTMIDNAIVSFDEGSQLNKFYFGEQNANIYILQDGKEYAIVSAEAKGEVPVNFKAKENGEYTLTVSSTLYSQLSTLSSLHLIDNLAGADIDLLQTPSYTFTARNDDYASRFKLVFNVQQGGEVADEDFAFISNGELIVNGEGILQVFDVTGRVLVTGDARRQISTAGFAPGVYVLQLIDGKHVRTQKIVVE